MRQEIIDLYDDFTHRSLDRRAFMNRLTAMVGSATAAAAMVKTLEASPAAAAIVPEDDSRVAADMVEFEPGLSGYLAWPVDAPGRLPAVVVVHENRGLNAHIRDVARRFATEGFVALAVDFLSPLGGTPADEDEARDMIGTLDPGDVTEKARLAIAWLSRSPLSTGRVGIVGFCWGGGVVGRVAVAEPRLGAGVVFYGQAPETEGVAGIQAPLQMHYAGLDDRINAGIPAFREALDAAGRRYEIHMYDGVNHAFHNDTSEARYDAEAAALAWRRTVGFLHAELAHTNP